MEPQRPNELPVQYAHWNVGAGLIFALASLIAAPLAGAGVGGALGNIEGQPTWLTLFAGTFFTGCFGWWLLMAQQQRFAPWRGAITGIVVAILSYPVVLTLTELVQRDWQHLGIATLLPRLLGVLLLSALTLLTTGLAAAAVMAAAGAMAAWLLVRADPRTAAVAAANVARGGLGLFNRLFRVVAALAVLTVALLAVLFVWLWLRPIDLGPLAHDGTPPAPLSYAEAMTAIDEIAASEATMPLDPRCRSFVRSHGAKTVRAVIYFHGFTNCPAQAAVLAEELFAKGYNVYVPRLPGHGEKDTMTLALADLTAEGLIETADSAIGIASGLGDDVTVIGLSAGGTMATWVAQDRADVGQSIAISPFLGAYAVPPWATRVATSLLLALPNIMVWWDSSNHEPIPGMEYAYPRYATHGLAQVLRLGQAVLGQAERNAPAGRAPGMLLNEADVSVSNIVTGWLLTDWRRKGATILEHTIPLDLALPHDVIDPHQPDADIGTVYPMLIDMIGR